MNVAEASKGASVFWVDLAPFSHDNKERALFQSVIQCDENEERL